ncbi:MAG: hypothetical protein MPJ08_04075 [Nitrosopumilus sp.]|nr:hypothetical protein [Nitrosopumilus sp.]MDA7990499.1 hypothetical protein [Gammaproteobacteria bacterium]
MIYQSPLFGKIREYFEGRDGFGDTVFVYAPYIQTAVLEDLLRDIRDRIVVVTTWEPRDIISGSSELSLYPFCREHGISLYVASGMHLKVYSYGLRSAILATGNVSRRGLMPGGNYEAGVLVEELSAADRLYLEGIRRGARLVDDAMYEALSEWAEEQGPGDEPDLPGLEEIVPDVGDDDFLVSALPMTRSIDLLADAYRGISEGDPPDDPELAACAFHDLANYGIPTGLPDGEFRERLSEAFFAHPFIRRIDEFINPEAYFGRIKEWVQDNCTDVPVPSRRELTGNVQVLLEWFAELGGRRYEVDVPGRRSQRIRKIYS